MQVTMTLTNQGQTVIWPDDQLRLDILTTPIAALPAGAVLLNLTNRRITGVGSPDPKATGSVLVRGRGDEPLAEWTTALAARLTDEAATLPALLTEVAQVLAALGYEWGDTVARKPAKTRHRFDRQLADRPLFVDYGGATATVFWRKAKELEVAAGATLAQEPILNKDGSPRYGTKYAEKLRADHAGAIAGAKTTAAVTLRSVNEVGMFLYYGDTNGWLVLKDADGNSLDALTRVD